MTTQIKVGPNGIDEEAMKRFYEERKDKILKLKLATDDLSTPEPNVLDALLASVKPVDYHLSSQLANTADLKQKHFIVTTIDELLKLTSKLKWGLCVHKEHLYVFNGQYWKPIDACAFKMFLGKVAAKMGMQAVDAKYYQVQEQLYKQFLSAASLPPPETRKDLVLINLKNGTYEIAASTCRLRPFDRSDFLTYQLPFNFDKGARAPLFEKYLNRVLPAKELQLVLAEFMGYIFARHLKLSKCLLLYGSGANGKSVFFDIINALLGKENISSFSLKNLNEEHNRAMIMDKLLNYGSEINASIERDVFKTMVSGEPIQARLKYQNSIMIEDYARLCFNCNELPQDVEHTKAYFRRFLIIPFSETIPEEEQDPELAKRIIDKELSGVFNWVLTGLDSLLKQKQFTQSKIVNHLLDEYKLESDSVYQFISEAGYEKSLDPAFSLKASFEDYSRFCADSGYHRVAIKKYAKRLRSHGIPVKRSGAGGKTFVFYSKIKTVLE